MSPSDPAKGAQGFSSLDNINSAYGQGLSGQPYNLSFIFTWMAIAIAIIGAISIWLLDSSVLQSKKQKLTQKSTLIQKLASSEYAALDVKVGGLKDAYDQVKDNLTNQFYVSDFLPQMYQRIDNDVQIKNVSITTDGRLNLDGVAGNYRAVADQILALQGFPGLSSVELLSTSMNISSSGKTEVPFVITGEINKDLEATTSVIEVSDSTDESFETIELSSDDTYENTNSSTTGGL